MAALRACLSLNPRLKHNVRRAAKGRVKYLGGGAPHCRLVRLR